jgi:hypothetical protein
VKYPVVLVGSSQKSGRIGTGIFHDLTILFVFYHGLTKQLDILNIFHSTLKFGGFSPYTNFYCTSKIVLYTLRVVAEGDGNIQGGSNMTGTDSV